MLPVYRFEVHGTEMLIFWEALALVAMLTAMATVHSEFQKRVRRGCHKQELRLPFSCR